MPGIRLSDTERRLKGWWNSLSPTDECYLKQITIISETPIRGIKECDLSISYPVTILCGKNGSGKSTLLQLAALAFHHQNKKKRKTFKDFFYKTKYDAPNEGVSLEWIYTTDKRVDVCKGSKKWMHYERRPIKEVWFVSPREILLAQGSHEQKDIDNALSQDFLSLNAEYLAYLNEILERGYTSAEEIESKNISKCCQGQTSYSCLNMGVGERAIIHLLKVFQQASPKSLIAIDEIEMGIHPFALTKLAEIIQKIVQNKKLQVFATTHSRDFIDGFPREARILVERNGDEVSPINSPTTMYAISRMANKISAEVTVYCEDRVAKEIIMWSSKELKTRIYVVAAGCQSTLPQVARAHSLSKNPSTPLIYWDGDVEKQDMKEYLSKAALSKPISHAKFLSEQSPEKDILDVLKQEDIQHKLATQIGLTESDVSQITNQCASDPDEHHILDVFSERTGIDKAIILKELVLCLVAGNQSLSNDIYQNIKKILEGKNVYASSDENKWEFKSIN